EGQGAGRQPGALADRTADGLQRAGHRRTAAPQLRDRLVDAAQLPQGREVALVLLVGGPGRTVGVLERAGYPGLQLCELRRGRRRMLDARLRELPAQRLPPVVGLLRGVPGVADAPLERLGVRTSGREAASLCRIE